MFKVRVAQQKLTTAIVVNRDLDPDVEADVVNWAHINQSGYATDAQWNNRVTLFQEFKSELSPPGGRFICETLVGTHIGGI